MDNHFSFDLTNFKPIESGWENYIMGVVHELQKLGVKIQGLNGQFKGDVPIGENTTSNYQNKFGIELSLYTVSIENGARLIN